MIEILHDLMYQNSEELWQSYGFCSLYGIMQDFLSSTVWESVYSPLCVTKTRQVFTAFRQTVEARHQSGKPQSLSFPRSAVTCNIYIYTYIYIYREPSCTRSNIDYLRNILIMALSKIKFYLLQQGCIPIPFLGCQQYRYYIGAKEQLTIRLVTGH